ncbi:Globin-coupled histidine kinase [Thiorhodovibrio winogradskyi]|uniref:histidine kinase n=1 Tax=Thiorhodovibrio winogradskyi TaxID=77007 RepID=A0ABZ0S9L1_9GAMM|nr:XrtA/PEP-CTERM system histidine kinase PrsK [Thiorhodovibrio winogradskyi]
MVNVASLTYLAALIPSGILFLLLLTAWRGRLRGLSALIGIGGILLWASVQLLASRQVTIISAAIPVADAIRNLGLFFLLTSALAPLITRKIRLFWYVAITSTLVPPLGLVILPDTFPSLATVFSQTAISRLSPYFWLLQTILGLLLVEQVFRNYPSPQRWAIKHLCLGIGAIFAYDLFFFSDTILLQRIDEHLWQARGLATALAVPFIAVSLARNPSWSLDIHISRSVVFHSATLLGSGVYLMAMALAGYYVRAFSGAWGATLQIAFLFAAGLFLLTLLFSNHLRAKFRIFLSEHFFSFKYDYRAEWQRFTNNLAATGHSTPKSIVEALAEIVNSPGGLLWAKTERGNFEPIDKISAAVETQAPLTLETPLVDFMSRSGWIIDLAELRAKPDRYEGIDLPEWIFEGSDCWLVIPLFFRAELIGFVALIRSKIIRHVNWEDRSLLKTAGLQAAGMLAQYQSDRALMRAQQFEAFNQLAAYVAHDLKNLLAQQSLIVTNADKHKHNPAFIDDVILTIKNSVDRMERLMTQLRHGKRELESRRCIISTVLAEAISRSCPTPPIPVLKVADQDIVVMADEERLITSLAHLLKNAREATSSDGSVSAELLREEATAIIKISDDGVGMSADFVTNRLFKPFDSTKGLTGMGIGAFESREYIRALGGDLQVDSKPGEGTLFTIRLPCPSNPKEATDHPAKPLEEGIFG